MGCPTFPPKCCVKYFSHSFLLPLTPFSPLACTFMEEFVNASWPLQRFIRRWHPPAVDFFPFPRRMWATQDAISPSSFVSARKTSGKEVPFISHSACIFQLHFSFSPTGLAGQFDKNVVDDTAFISLIYFSSASLTREIGLEEKIKMCL